MLNENREFAHDKAMLKKDHEIKARIRVVLKKRIFWQFCGWRA